VIFTRPITYNVEVYIFIEYLPYNIGYMEDIVFLHLPSVSNIRDLIMISLNTVEMPSDHYCLIIFRWQNEFPFSLCHLLYVKL